VFERKIFNWTGEYSIIFRGGFWGKVPFTGSKNSLDKSLVLQIRMND
jgi:hypothetical protein